LIGALLISTLSSAQNSTETKCAKHCFWQCSKAPQAPTVKVNPYTGKVTGLAALDKLRWGSLYVVQVDSVNLNLYRVSVDHKDTVSGSALAFPEFGSVAGDALSKLVSGVSMSTKASVKEGESEKTMFNLGRVDLLAKAEKEDAKKYKQRYQEMLAQRSLDISMHADTLQVILSECQSLATDVMEGSLALRKLVVDTPYTSVAADYYKMFRAKCLDLLKQQREISALQNDLAQWNLHHRSVALFESDKDVKADADKVAAALTQLATNAAEQLKSIDALNLAKLIDPLHALELNAGRDYVSFPLQYRRGTGELNVKVFPIDSASRLPTYNLKYEFPSQGAWYFGVSGGLHWSGLNSDAYSRRATKDVVFGDTVDVFTVVQENSLRREFGIQSLLTVGGKFGRGKVGFHGVVGPAMVISDNLRPRVMAGVGLSLGQEQNLVLDFGLVAGYVDRLSAVYQDGGPFVQSDDPLVVSKLDNSWFFSLGYMFWKGK